MNLEVAQYEQQRPRSESESSSNSSFSLSPSSPLLRRAPPVSYYSSASSSSLSPKEASSAVPFPSSFRAFTFLVTVTLWSANLYTFPKALASYSGSGALVFVLLWTLFLLLWTVPLVLTEMCMGRGAGEASPIQGLARLMGKSARWMGGWLMLLNVFACAYCVVVCAWCLYIFFHIVAHGVPSTSELRVVGVCPLLVANNTNVDHFWSNYDAAPWTCVLQAFVVLVAVWVTYKGVELSERLVNLLVVLFFALLLFVATYCMFLPNAESSLGVIFRSIFNLDLSDFSDVRIWANALLESAKVSGAGIGLYFTVASRLSPSQDVVKLAIGVPLVGYASAMAVSIVIYTILFSQLRSFSCADSLILDTIASLGPRSPSFIWVAVLLGDVAGGPIVTALFFLAMGLAGLCFILARVKMAVEGFLFCTPFKLWAVCLLTGFCVYSFGLIMMFDLTFLLNQGYLQKYSSIVCGLMFAYFLHHIGVDDFLEEFVAGRGEGHHVRCSPRYFRLTMHIVVPVLGVLVLLHWIIECIMEDDRWYNPFSEHTLMTCLFQWVLGCVILYIFNRVRHSAKFTPLTSRDRISLSPYQAPPRPRVSSYYESDLTNNYNENRF